MAALRTFRRSVFLKEVNFLCYEQSLGDFDSVIPLNDVCIPVRIPYDVLDDWRIRRFIHDFFDVDPAVGVVLFSEELQLKIVLCSICAYVDLYNLALSQRKSLDIDNRIYQCRLCQVWFYLCEQCCGHYCSHKLMDHLCCDCLEDDVEFHVEFGLSQQIEE